MNEEIDVYDFKELVLKTFDVLLRNGDLKGCKNSIYDSYYECEFAPTVIPNLTLSFAFMEIHELKKYECKFSLKNEDILTYKIVDVIDFGNKANIYIDSAKIPEEKGLELLSQLKAKEIFALIYKEACEEENLNKMKKIKNNM